MTPVLADAPAIENCVTSRWYIAAMKLFWPKESLETYPLAVMSLTQKMSSKNNRLFLLKKTTDG
jgi:hypothetical protein